MPRKLWLELILPLNMQTKTSLLAATSPKGAGNSYCSYLLKLKDGDELVFNVINLQEICKACRAAKLDDCEHKGIIRSTNKSSKKQRLTMLMYSEGDADTAKEELLGQERSSKGGIIPDEYVEQFKHNVCELGHRPRAVYCSFDPGGGSSTGQLGITMAVEINTISEGVKLVVRIVFILFVCVLLVVLMSHSVRYHGLTVCPKVVVNPYPANHDAMLRMSTSMQHRSKLDRTGRNHS